MRVCVCVCVRARACACMRVHACVRFRGYRALTQTLSRRRKRQERVTVSGTQRIPWQHTASYARGPYQPSSTCASSCPGIDWGAAIVDAGTDGSKGHDVTHLCVCVCVCVCVCLSMCMRARGTHACPFPPPPLPDLAHGISRGNKGQAACRGLTHALISVADGLYQLLRCCRFPPHRHLPSEDHDRMREINEQI